jgi:hypothetical protein
MFARMLGKCLDPLRGGGRLIGKHHAHDAVLRARLALLQLPCTCNEAAASAYYPHCCATVLPVRTASVYDWHKRPGSAASVASHKHLWRSVMLQHNAVQRCQMQAMGRDLQVALAGRVCVAHVTLAATLGHCQTVSQVR